MKLVFVFLAFVSSSMTYVPGEFTAHHQCVPQAEVSCIVESRFVCPPGYLDGCITHESKFHECLPIHEGPSCDLPLRVNCPENFQDGCHTGETEVHLCLPLKGELCSSGKSFSCPSGFEDSCSR